MLLLSVTESFQRSVWALCCFCPDLNVFLVATRSQRLSTVRLSLGEDTFLLLMYLEELRGFTSSCSERAWLVLWHRNGGVFFSLSVGFSYIWFKGSFSCMKFEKNFKKSWINRCQNTLASLFFLFIFKEHSPLEAPVILNEKRWALMMH